MAVNTSKVRDSRNWAKWLKAGAVMFDQQDHPERKPDEVFITNADHLYFYCIGWKTKRMGLTPLDNRGKPLGRRWPNSFPVFAQIGELEKAGVIPNIMRRPISPK